MESVITGFQLKYNWMLNNGIGNSCRTQWICINLNSKSPLWQAEGWDGEGDGREVWERGGIGVPMADSIKQLSFN